MGNANVRLQDITVLTSDWVSSGGGYIHDVSPTAPYGGVVVYFQAQVQLVGDYVQLPYTLTSPFPAGYLLYYSTCFDTHFAGCVRLIYQNPNGVTTAPTRTMVFRVVSFSGMP